MLQWSLITLNSPDSPEERKAYQRGKAMLNYGWISLAINRAPYSIRKLHFSADQQCPDIIDYLPSGH